MPTPSTTHRSSNRPCRYPPAGPLLALLDGLELFRPSRVGCPRRVGRFRHRSEQSRPRNNRCCSDVGTTPNLSPPADAVDRARSPVLCSSVMVLAPVFCGSPIPRSVPGALPGTHDEVPRLAGCEPVRGAVARDGYGCVTYEIKAAVPALAQGRRSARRRTSSWLPSHVSEAK